MVDVREEVAAANALYDRAAAAAVTDRRTLFDDVHRAVEAVAAAATRTAGDLALRAVMGDAQDRARDAARPPGGGAPARRRRRGG